jgi:hypothetical protein
VGLRRPVVSLSPDRRPSQKTWRWTTKCRSRARDSGLVRIPGSELDSAREQTRSRHRRLRCPGWTGIGVVLDRLQEWPGGALVACRNGYVLGTPFSR